MAGPSPRPVEEAPAAGPSEPEEEDDRPFRDGLVGGPVSQNLFTYLLVA